MSTHWTDRLSEYLDDELTTPERVACEQHLATCTACRQIVEELREITMAARDQSDRQPAADLWPGVLARLGTVTQEPFASDHRLTVDGRGGRRGVARQVTLSLPQLALAASLLVAVSSAVAYVAAGRIGAEPGSSEPAPIQAMAEEPSFATSNDAMPADFADASFDRAVADFERILAEQRDTLDPRTVIVIERNLAAIDDAIRQARAALDADPANTFLNSHLADARRRKLDLLRRAASLSSSGGD